MAAGSTVEDATQAPQPAKASACCICNLEVSKYKCPACQAATCSLSCCKQHKQQTGCSGNRNKLAFISMQDFSDRHLISDYRWLEEVVRVDDNARRHRPPIPRRELPQHLGSLVHQARLRGVHLLIMCPGMQRRQVNSTRYDPRSRKLFWRLEWRFPATAAAATSLMPISQPSHHAAAASMDAAPAQRAAAAVTAARSDQQQQQQQQVVLFDGKVDEEATLSDVLARHLEYSLGLGAQALQVRAYKEAGVHALTVLMRKERCAANAVRYYRLDTAASLKSQLSGKLIIEFPTLLVLLPGDDSSYDVISPDDLQAEQQQQRQRHLSGRVAPAAGHHPLWPPPPPPQPRPAMPSQEGEARQQQGKSAGCAGHTTQPQPPKRHLEAGEQGEAAAKRMHADTAAATDGCSAQGAGGQHGQDVLQRTAGEGCSGIAAAAVGCGHQAKDEPAQHSQRRYYYYDPHAGADEDADDCLAGLADDDSEDGGGGARASLPENLGAAAAAVDSSGTQPQQVQDPGKCSQDGCELPGSCNVMMRLLGQYQDENEIDLSDDIE